MLHGLRHRRFAYTTWLVLLLALLQPALAHATYLHALHRAAHAHGQSMQAASLPLAGAGPGACTATARDAAQGDHAADAADAFVAPSATTGSSDSGHGHRDAGAVIGSETSVSADDRQHGDCDCRNCPVLASCAAACVGDPWLPALIATTSPDSIAAILPRVDRAHPCGLGSRGPPAAA